MRSPEEFRGEKLAPDHLPQEQSQVPGHIAGAANIPWVKAANDDGTFKSADELRELYEAEGITPDKEIIAYCRIGERSSHTWFALQELLGLRTASRTTTDRGPSTARWSGRRWSWAGSADLGRASRPGPSGLGPLRVAGRRIGSFRRTRPFRRHAEREVDRASDREAEAEPP